ncbi:MAG: hypothetical protein HY650_15770 [Acidobacteria bacterium]|nr:hypothetical protein [Acidobacteriota bacterium]
MNHPEWIRAFCVIVVCGQLCLSPARQSDPMPSRHGRSEAAVGYLFVSPNTGSNLSLAKALSELESAGEHNLLLAARRLTGCLGARAIIAKTLGNWTDGAEPSLLIKLRAVDETLRYVNSRLGLEARQKAVLCFQERAGGSATLYRIYLRSARRDLTAVARTLERNGIINRTFLPRKSNLIVYIVDPTGELHPRIVPAVARLGGRFEFIKGDAGFIGDADDRERGLAAFAAEIRNYEARHPKVKKNCGDTEGILRSTGHPEHPKGDGLHRARTEFDER